jgi:poly-beta-1,6-N-acetyl-D-glucosamine N-deacetylase
MNLSRWVSRLENRGEGDAKRLSLQTQRPGHPSFRLVIKLLILLALPLPLLLKPTFAALANQNSLKSSFADRVATADPNSSAATCGVDNSSAAAIAPSDQIAQLVNWTINPAPQLGTFVETLGPTLTAVFSARPFPEISDRARQARVPVIMYHDILSEKQVFFDVTPAEFEADLQLIRDKGLTPISLDQLVTHLATGTPLPAKPILLTFDDGYEGHYTHVLPLLRQYGYPATFAIYPGKVGTHIGRSSLNWDQLREMAADPLVTIAAHSSTHPPDLTTLPDDRLRYEIVESKRVLEEHLGMTIHHFVYPSGHYDQRVEHWLQMSGYRSGMTMNDAEDKFAGQSDNLLSIDRIGQSKLEEIVDQAYGGPTLPTWGSNFNFNTPIQVNRVTIDYTPLILISGGRPITIHADSRYQLPEILAKTNAVAAVDGAFFSLKSLDSNVMIGPVLSHNGGFVPGNAGENPLLKGRPLVLISPDSVEFVPFDPKQHNTLAGIQANQPDVTDAFVAAAWLVKGNQPQNASTFGTLYGFDAARHRAFWGIDQVGQPVIGVSTEPVDAVTLGSLLSRAGFREAVMLDSGASTSLAYQGESLVSYTPRPVPHAVALMPPQTAYSDCPLMSQRQDSREKPIQ